MVGDIFNIGVYFMMQRIKALNRARNLKTKKIKNAVKLFKYRLFYRGKTQLNTQEYQSVCVFLHCQMIGDAMVTGGFINRLRQKGFDVSVVVNKKIATLFDSMMSADAVYVIDHRNVKKIASQLNEKGIDLVVDFSDFENTSVLRERTLSLMDCKHAIGFNNPASTTYDTNVITPESVHITERMRHVLSLLEIHEDLSPSLTFKGTDMEDPRRFAESQGKKLIIFNPFASMNIRSLSMAQIYSVLDYLEQLEGYMTVLFDLGAGIDLSKYHNIVLNPFPDITRSFSLVQFSDFVITVDTAVVHLCAILNIKQYCIYNNRKFNDQFENNIVWGPNSPLAVPLYTSEFIGSDNGDDVSKFDISLLINRIASDLDNRP